MIKDFKKKNTKQSLREWPNIASKGNMIDRYLQVAQNFELDCDEIYV